MKPKTPTKSSANPPPMKPVPFLIGALCLFVASACMFALVKSHFTGTPAPGCGAGSACDEASKSMYGKIPGTTVPVSLLALSYFGSLLVGWLVSRGRVAYSLRGLIWLGGFISLLFIGIVVVEKLHCWLCITAHIANFVLVGVTERSFRPARVWSAPAGITAAVFALAMTGMVVADQKRIVEYQVQVEAHDDEALAALVAQNTSIAAAIEADAASTANDNAVAQPAAPTKPFTGRWRLGPEKSPIRIVMFTDYQCPDCRIFESRVMDIVEKRDDVSLSVKHFPFCTQCNRYVDRNLHGNACFAARAAEAAGILGGNEAFWKMHKWLFEVKGSFRTNEDLFEGVRQAGVPTDGFTAVMQSHQTLQNVQEDIEEAARYGLEMTPMIFVNGVEFKDWRQPAKLNQMIDNVAATNPPAVGPEHDKPPHALARYVARWEEMTPRRLPPAPDAGSFGKAGSGPEIIVYGDFEEPYTARADAEIRAYLAKHGGSYEFRLYPFNYACNPTLNENEARHKNACEMAAAARAARQLGGDEGYQKMHAWLFENRESFSMDKLKAAATAQGLDADKLTTAMESAEIKNQIVQEATTGRKLGINSIPRVFVNNKMIPRLFVQDLPILETILNKASN
ncbi:MAG: thioredoxin domain-containing protein [Phycisphaerae bacterium]